MCPSEEDRKNDTSLLAATRVDGRGSIDLSLRLKIEHLCLEELNKSGNHLSADKYQRFERLLLRIATRIAEPLLSQIHEANGGRTRRSHNLRMIADAFELQEVKRGQ